MDLIIRNRYVILYGSALAVLFFVLHWLELRFIIFSHAFEIYAGAIALIFTGLGSWIGLKLTRPKIEKVVIEKKVYVKDNENFVLNEEALNELGVSSRELEVLQLMAEGLSNKEIASRLFVSVNTVKTHSSNLFGKLGAERRTQAIELAKRYNLIP